MNFSLRSLLNSLSSALSGLRSNISSYFARPSASSSPPPTTTTGTTLPPSGTYINRYTQQSVPLGQPSPGYNTFGKDIRAQGERARQLGGAMVNVAGNILEKTATPVHAVSEPTESGGAQGFAGVNYLTQQSVKPYGGSYQPLSTATADTIGTFKSTTTPPPSASSSVSNIGKSTTTTTASAPQPTNVPPPPVGGSGSVITVGGGGGAPSVSAPKENPLPPPSTLPSDAIGKYEAMMRSLLSQYGNTGRVPVPLAGASPFGPSSAFGEILRQLQERLKV